MASRPWGLIVTAQVLVVRAVLDHHLLLRIRHLPAARHLCKKKKCECNSEGPASSQAPLVDDCFLRGSLLLKPPQHIRNKDHRRQQVAKLPVGIKTKSGLQRFGGGSKLQQLPLETRRVSTIWVRVDGVKHTLTT